MADGLDGFDWDLVIGWLQTGGTVPPSELVPLLRDIPGFSSVTESLGGDPSRSLDAAARFAALVLPQGTRLSVRIEDGDTVPLAPSILAGVLEQLRGPTGESTPWGISRGGAQVNGYEANLLLRLLDEYLRALAEGTRGAFDVYNDPDDLASLRDRLFVAHEHPDEDD